MKWEVVWIIFMMEERKLIFRHRLLVFHKGGKEAVKAGEYRDSQLN